jgi:putative tryptophan/tyrosine transport system substrate-binding protein
VSLFNVSLVPKQLELVRELVPNARVIAAIVNPDNPNTEAEERALNAAAGALGLVIHVLRASSENDVTAAFATIVQQGAGAVIVSFDAFFLSRNDQFVALAARHSLPAIYHWREFAESGGLMAYGTNLVDAYRQLGIYAGKILKGARPMDLPVWRQTKFDGLLSYAGDISDAYRLTGIYVGRVLKGEKPADLPVQQVTKVELYINLKTAKGLGLTIPNTLIGRADELIE